MSFLTNDSALTAHTLDTESLDGGSVEIFSHGVKITRGGGAKPYRNLDVNATGINVDVATMKLYGAQLWNGHATALRYLKVYDVAYPPTISDTPVKTIPLKAQAQTDLATLVGVQFVNGLGLRATTGIADSDTGAPSANDVVVNLDCSSVGGFVTGVVGTCPASATGAVITG